MPTTSVPGLFRLYGFPGACDLADATATVTDSAATAAMPAASAIHFPWFLTTCPPCLVAPPTSVPSGHRVESQHHRLEPPSLPACERLRHPPCRRRGQRLLDRAEEEVDRERRDHVQARRGRVEDERLECRGVQVLGDPHDLQQPDHGEG